MRIIKESSTRPSVLSATLLQAQAIVAEKRGHLDDAARLLEASTEQYQTLEVVNLDFALQCEQLARLKRQTNASKDADKWLQVSKQTRQQCEQECHEARKQFAAIK